MSFESDRASMDRFPPPIARGMRQSGAMTTCLPVQIDTGQWETAVFFEVGGKACKEDRHILRRTRDVIPVAVEVDIITHARASVVMLRFEVATRPDDPLVGEVLVTPGQGEVQFDTLNCLTEQRQMRWFFGDGDYRVIHSQQTALYDHERQGYGELLREAVNHDALVRMTGHYDAVEAMNEVVSHYQMRQPAP